MKLEQLAHAVEIANTGSFSKAAENLYLSQPGLSASIKQLEQELGRMAAGGGWSQHPSPAVGLCHSSITSTPLLFPGTCPHFTDGKTYIHQRSQSQEVAELEGVPRKLARTRGYLMKEWGIPSPPGAG